MQIIKDKISQASLFLPTLKEKKTKLVHVTRRSMCPISIGRGRPIGGPSQSEIELEKDENKKKYRLCLEWRIVLLGKESPNL
jgi:hypothetical protein